MYDCHDITKRDFLVYLDGFGIYINVLFARKHQIRQGQSVSKSLINLHYEEVPPMEPTTSHIWLSEEQLAASEDYVRVVQNNSG